MPKELRQIMFGEAEVVSAITEYHRHRALTMPRGTVTRCEILAEPALSATLFIEADGTATREVSIGTETLAAALILYCIHRKIPLPVDSEKGLRKLPGGRVALFVIKPRR